TEDLAHRPHRRLRQVLTKAGKIRADILAKKLPKRAWQQCSAGNGARGLRFYDWAMTDLVGSGPGRHQPLFRRNRRIGDWPSTAATQVAGDREDVAGPPGLQSGTQTGIRPRGSLPGGCGDAVEGGKGFPVEADITPPRCFPS
ncbi:hypothetical protein NI939_08140, partial [Streptomyces sp. RKCA-744]|nr:hypothetical protein [Streptomyces sp. RKCA744]